MTSPGGTAPPSLPRPLAIRPPEQLVIEIGTDRGRQHQPYLAFFPQPALGHLAGSRLAGPARIIVRSDYNGPDYRR